MHIEAIAELKLDEIDPDLQVFLTLSAELTGFSEVELLGTGMLTTYYYALMKEQDQDGVRRFLQKAREILSSPDRQAAIRSAFIDLPPTASGPNPPYDEMRYDGLARRIILLWYSGVWTTMNWKNEKPQRDRTFILSARAYQQGLIWLAAETHPAGAKQPGFGSWSEAPL